MFLWIFRKFFSVFLLEDFSILNQTNSHTWLGSNVSENTLKQQASNKLRTIKTGVVTDLGMELGIINGSIVFDPSMINSHTNVKEGDKVEVEFDENGVIDAIRVVEEVDEEIFQDCKDTYTIVGMITERQGRIFKIQPHENDFSLDEIVTSFVPLEGDWVQLEVSEKVNSKLTPLRSKIVKGHVTSWKGRGGVINHNIWFNLESCESGFLSMEGDPVIASVIENSFHESCNWRALTVAGDFSTKKTKATSEIIDSADNLIDIVGDIYFKNIPLDTSSQTEISLNNRQPCDCQLLEVRFKKNSQFSVPNLPLTINAGEVKSIVVDFRAQFIGDHSEAGVFIFEPGGEIRRIFEATVNLNTMPEMSRGGRYRPKPRIANPNINELQTFGQRRHVFNRFSHRVTAYKIPERIQNIFKEIDQNNTEDIFQSVLEWAPYLEFSPLPDTYANYFHALLYFEECGERKFLDNFQLTRVFMQRAPGELLELHVPGLEESRPSLCAGDQVIVREPWRNVEPPVAHHGYIHFVLQQSVRISFNKEFFNTYDLTDCDITFKPGAGTYAHEHDAVKRAVTKLGTQVLFPEKVIEQPSQVHTDFQIDWYISYLNEVQKETVQNILRGIGRPLPYVIFGPPGTGKTLTLIEAILQVIRHVPGARVLVAGPSNSSADLIAQRLIKYGKLRVGEIVRIMAFSRAEETFPEDLLDYISISNLSSKLDDTVSGRHLITVGTCTSLSTLHLHNLPRGIFTHIFVDEAGYATEPQALIPLSFLDPKSGQVILAGDHQQLGPIVCSNIAKTLGLGESLLVRLMLRPLYSCDTISFPDSRGFDPRLVSQLVKNYRSVPEILKLPSDLFYNGRLEAEISGLTGREHEIYESFSKLLSVKTRFIFHGLRGQCYQEEDSPSWMNPQEIGQVVLYLRKLAEAGVKVEEIGVITPYKKQTSKLRQVLSDMQMDVPKIGTVEEFQGQERQVIVLSCVRSGNILRKKPTFATMGFLVDQRRLNVSITRARALTIIVGNPHTLATDPYWKNVVAYAVKIGGYLGCDIPVEL